MATYMERLGMKSNRNIIAAAAAACGIVALAGSASAANILINGGFETQGSGDATTAANWNLSTGGGIAPTSATRDTNNPETGSFDLHLVVTGSGSAGGPVAQALSTFDTAGPATVTPGVVYTWTFDSVGNFGPGTVLNTFFDFYNASGSLIARDQKANGAGTSAVYGTHTMTDTAPAGAAYYDVFFDFATGAFDGASGDISIDNVTFSSPTTVPEPASISLLAIGAAGLLVRRRK